ncbi:MULTISPECIES: hypothetical protein [unclassified Beijerinckia]|uniref:hypothetical protein n=1 Tax=unclassified Beijerinckia TaxID=2638183 RepID=UPI00089CD241|nr:MULTISPECIES: hypothetical protein [unclassified Beijerinckia]MDH7796376.1 hypothetical protein [Beijerinckia sp. GAS462]SEC42457.1 hypothetical protein SAMN05443249_2659 [Beijerinckia sp. 28-YEA-48]
MVKTRIKTVTTTRVRIEREQLLELLREHFNMPRADFSQDAEWFSEVEIEETREEYQDG